MLLRVLCMLILLEGECYARVGEWNTLKVREVCRAEEAGKRKSTAGATMRKRPTTKEISPS